MTKELMTRKDDIPNFSDASCSLSAFILEEEYKGTLPTLDVKDVIFRKIIQILVQFFCMPNAKFFNSELYYFERILAISHYLSPKGTFCNDVHLTPPLRLYIIFMITNQPTEKNQPKSPSWKLQ